MRMPIRNKGDRPLTVLVELQCDQFEVPVGGEAIVRLEDGRPHSIDLEDGWVTIWDEGGDASVEVITSGDKRIDDALMLVRVWLPRLGADDEALLINGAVEAFELTVGYFAARDRVFRAFYEGFANEECTSSADTTLNACYRAGVTAARLNGAARKTQSFPELGSAPFDTDTARSAFDRALGNVG
jgi:hypothetical protein